MGMGVGIIVGLIAFGNLGGRDRPVIVRMVGVIVPRMLVTVSVANLMRMLHLDNQIRASHVEKSDGDDQQTLENGSHVI